MNAIPTTSDLPADSLYRELILDEYKHPRNKGTLAHPTHASHVTNPLCGDEIDLTLIVDNGVVADVKFAGVGCAISQACASLFTDHIKGKKVADVLVMDERAIIALLGFSPNPARMKCAVLVERAVADALQKGYGLPKKTDL